MEAKVRAKFEGRAKIVKAMAHPTRLFILESLSQRERCVSDLTSMVKADTSTVSKHLLVLRHAGLVSAQKRQANVYYRLEAPCVLGMFPCVERVIRGNIKRHRDVYS